MSPEREQKRTSNRPANVHKVLQHAVLGTRMTSLSLQLLVYVMLAYK